MPSSSLMDEEGDEIDEGDTEEEEQPEPGFFDYVLMVFRSINTTVALATGMLLEAFCCFILWWVFDQGVVWIIFIFWNVARFPLVIWLAQNQCPAECDHKQPDCPFPNQDRSLRIAVMSFAIFPFVAYLPWLTQASLDDCIYSQENRTVGMQVVANYGFVDCHETFWQQGRTAHQLQFLVAAVLPVYYLTLYIKSNTQLDLLFEKKGAQEVLQLLILDVFDVCQFISEGWNPAQFAFIKASPHVAPVLYTWIIPSAWLMLFLGTMRLVSSWSQERHWKAYHSMSAFIIDISFLVFRTGCAFHGCTPSSLCFCKNLLCGWFKIKLATSEEEDQAMKEVLRPVFAFLPGGGEVAAATNFTGTDEQ